jgi:hypothetical protein
MTTTTRVVFGMVVIVLATVFFALMVLTFSRFNCFLDVLNAFIEAQCEFRPFYGGTPATPPVRAVIPELGALEDAFPAIQAEMEAVLRDRDRIPVMHDVYDKMFFKTKGEGASLLTNLIYGPDTGLFDRIGSPGWQTFNLITFHQLVPHNAKRCPVTVKLLLAVPGVQSALFSIIAPGTFIPPHSDPAKGVIRYHLALKVPTDRERCYITVDEQRYCWETGKAVLFDDVFEHWVRNDTDEERVVLFVDILRPLTGVAALLQGAANVANCFHPGVRGTMNASAVPLAR